MGWNMLRNMFLVSLASLLLLAPAQAQSTRRVLENFTFFGKWSPHCDQPAGPANSLRNVYVARGGEVQFTESLGAGYKDNLYRVLDAKRIAPDKVVLRIELNGTITQDLTMVKEGGRIRTVANQRTDGQFVVKDGIVLANGNATPWVSRCAKAR